MTWETCQQPCLQRRRRRRHCVRRGRPRRRASWCPQPRRSRQVGAWARDWRGTCAAVAATASARARVLNACGDRLAVGTWISFSICKLSPPCAVAARGMSTLQQVVHERRNFKAVGGDTAQMKPVADAHAPAPRPHRARASAPSTLSAERRQWCGSTFSLRSENSTSGGRGWRGVWMDGREPGFFLSWALEIRLSHLRETKKAVGAYLP